MSKYIAFILSFFLISSYTYTQDRFYFDSVYVIEKKYIETEKIDSAFRYIYVKGGYIEIDGNLIQIYIEYIGDDKKPIAEVMFFEKKNYASTLYSNFFEVGFIKKPTGNDNFRPYLRDWYYNWSMIFSKRMDIVIMVSSSDRNNYSIIYRLVGFEKYTNYVSFKKIYGK